MKKILSPHSIMDRSDFKKSYREGHNITDSEEVKNMITPKEATVFLSLFSFSTISYIKHGLQSKRKLKMQNPWYATEKSW